MHMSFREVKTYTHVYEISNLLEKSYGKTKVKMYQTENVCWCSHLLFKKENNDTCYREVKENGKTGLNQLD